MKALSLYDSQFGNTEKVARAEVTLLRATEARAESLSGYDLLIVGSPTQRFHATEPVAHLLEGRTLAGVRASAFDTRFDMAEVDSRVLRLAVKVAGAHRYQVLDSHLCLDLEELDSSVSSVHS